MGGFLRYGAQQEYAADAYVNILRRRADVYIGAGIIYYEHPIGHFEKQGLSRKSTHRMWDKLYES